MNCKSFFFFFSLLSLYIIFVPMSEKTIIQKDFGEKISYDLVSKNNRNIKEIFEKFHNKIKVNFKNKQVLKKIK